MFGTNAYAQAPFAAAGGNAFFAFVSETVVAQDALSAKATFAVQFSDSATGSDTTAARFSIFSAVSEAATGADTASANFTVGASISEIATISGTSAAVAAFLASVFDSATASDAISSVPNYAVQVSDSAQAAADFGAGLVAVAYAAESVVAQDDPSSIYIIPADVVESVIALDVLNTNAAHTIQLAEIARATQSFVGNVNFAASVTAQAAVSDLGNAYTQQFFAVNISEGVYALDGLLGRELWEQIDDTEFADWTDILVPTIIEDIAVFGGANFGVLTYAGNLQQRYDPNPSTWNEIDDTQDTVWTDIVAV